MLAEEASEELLPETFQQGLLGGPPREPVAFGERIGALVDRLESRPREASLVLPDEWLRTAFAEVGELPRREEAREELLRWKLKRLVPFRVDELRVRAVEVEPLPAQAGSEENRRVLLGFGIESLLAAVERGFADHGVRIGRITCSGLAALAALDGAVGGTDHDGLVGLALASASGYSLVFVRHGRPVLHRAKVVGGELPQGTRGSFVSRDLKLTRSFLEESYPEVRLERLLLVADDPEIDRDAWVAWIEDGLGERPELLGAAHVVPLKTRTAAPPWSRLLPLVGAVAEEVA